MSKDLCECGARVGDLVLRDVLRVLELGDTLGSSFPAFGSDPDGLFQRIRDLRSQLVERDVLWLHASETARAEALEAGRGVHNSRYGHDEGR